VIKVVVIGLGRMGISHAAISNTHPDVNLVGMCDASSLILNTLRQYAPTPCFADYRKMLDEMQPDCAIIATPTSSHVSILREVMERGLHVFVEKPFGIDLADGHQLVDIAARQQLVNQVGYHLRFVAAFMEAKRLLDKGAIGDVYHITAETYGPLVLGESSNWRGKKNEAGGCLYDYASHAINLVNYFIGVPDAVGGTVLKSIYSKEVEDAVYATLAFDNRCTGQLAVNWSDETHRKMTNQVTLMGSLGKIIVDRQECRIYLRRKAGFEDLSYGWNVKYTTELTKPVWFYLRGEEYSAQIGYFIDRVKTGNTDNINSFASALETSITVDMLRNDAKKLACGGTLF
jgi:predicted dehydrogenase